LVDDKLDVSKHLQQKPQRPASPIHHY